MKPLLILLVWLLIEPVSKLKQPVSPTKARLIIYRQREFGGNTYTLLVNGKKVGTLPTNRHRQVDVAPGRVKIESTNWYFADSQTLWLTLQPGRTYYVKAVEDVDFLTRTLLLAPVSDEQARQELRRVKPVEIAPSAQKD